MNIEMQQLADDFHEEHRQLLIKMFKNEPPQPPEVYDAALLDLRDRYLPQFPQTEDQLALRKVILESRFSLAIEFDSTFKMGVEIFVARHELGFEDIFRKASHTDGIFAFCRNHKRLDIALPYVKEVLDEAEKVCAAEPSMYLDLCESFRALHERIVKALDSSGAHKTNSPSTDP